MAHETRSPLKIEVSQEVEGGDFEESVRSRLQSDDFYRQFLDPACNPTTLVSRSVTQGSLKQTLEQLNVGISRLEQDISHAVGHHYDSLLKQVTTIHDLEKVLLQVRLSVNSLQASLTSIEDDITVPFVDISNRTLQLERMHATCELLRKILRLLYLTHRLREHLRGGATDLSKAAQCLFEIDSIVKDGDLNGIHVVQAEVNFITQARKDALATAEALFEKALEGRNQADLVVTLEAFHNFGKLAEKVYSSVDKYAAVSKTLVKKAVDMSGHVEETKGHGPGSVVRVGGPQLNATGSWKATLWSKIQNTWQYIFNQYMQIKTMQNVLSKKKEGSTQATYLDMVIEQTKKLAPAEMYWKAMCKHWADELGSISRSGSNYVDAAFIEDYPKFAQCAREVLRDLESHGMLSTPANQIRSKEESELFGSFSRHQLGYLALVTARLTESLNMMFSTSNMSEGISFSILGSFSKMIYQELDVVRPIELLNTKAVLSRQSTSLDGGLAHDIAKVVGKSLQFFVNKAEEKVIVDSSAFSFEDIATSSQQKNAALFFAVCLLHNRIESLFLITTPESAQYLQSSQKTLEGLSTEIIRVYFEKIYQFLETAIMMMHQSKSGLLPSDETCSAYMIELRRRAKQIHQTALPIFQNPSGIGSRPPLAQSLFFTHLQSLRIQLARFFVRSVCHLRDITETHRMQLAADCAEMPISLQPFTSLLQNAPPSLLSGTETQWPQMLKQLHSVRALLFIDSADVSKFSNTQNTNPISSLGFGLICIHLIGRSSNEIATPHQVQKVAFKAWLDQLDGWTDSQIVDAVSKALQTYANAAKAEGKTQYHPVYPVLCDLVQISRGSGQ